jgi:hypothetical protein
VPEKDRQSEEERDTEPEHQHGRLPDAIFSAAAASSDGNQVLWFIERAGSTDVTESNKLFYPSYPS